MSEKKKNLRSSSSAEEVDPDYGVKIISKLPHEKLPTLGEIIGYILYLVREESKSYTDAQKICCDSVSNLWIAHNVYPTYYMDVKRRLKREVENFRNLGKTSLE